MQGLLLLSKPEGITSFSAVSAVKRIASEKRVGHTGTLDPMATGVLPILLGRATVLSSLMLDADKRYTAKIRLGTVTDTDDITGEILSQNEVNITNEELYAALEHFTGKIKQKPPIYSAIKKAGVRLYKLAREGKAAEIFERDVEVYSIKLIEGLNSNFEFCIDTHVSKGTYIRSLARDIGEFLGCGATLSGLERTYASGFDISECVPLDKLNSENILEYILSEEKVVSHLAQISITEKQAIRFSNGGQLSFDRLNLDSSKVTENELFRVKLGEKLLGIGFADLKNSQICIKCILNYPE